MHAVTLTAEGPELAAVWQEQPDLLAIQALSVLDYLALAMRQVGEEDGTLPVGICQGYGWLMTRIARVLRRVEHGRPEPLEHIRCEIGNPRAHPSDHIEMAKECLQIVAAHAASPMFQDCPPSDNEAHGLAELMKLAMLHLDDAETAIAMRHAQGGHHAA